MLAGNPLLGVSRVRRPSCLGWAGGLASRVTNGTAEVLGVGPGGGAGGTPTEAVAGAAELGAGASVSIALVESLSTTSALLACREA